MEDINFTKLLETVARNIKNSRRGLSYTQKQMADHGFSARHMQDIESGRSNLTLKTLWRLAEIFKIQLKDLVHKSEPTLAPCEYKNGVFENIMPYMPFSCLVWQYDNLPIGGTYRLKKCNKRAEDDTYLGLSSKLGASIEELFPATRALGFIQFLDEARKQNKGLQITDFFYSDSRVPFANFSVSAIPICHNEIVVLFEKQNEKLLMSQISRRETELRHEIVKIAT